MVQVNRDVTNLVKQQKVFFTYRNSVESGTRKIEHWVGCAEVLKNNLTTSWQGHSSMTDILKHINAVLGFSFLPFRGQPFYLFGLRWQDLGEARFRYCRIRRLQDGPDTFARFRLDHDRGLRLPLVLGLEKWKRESYYIERWPRRFRVPVRLSRSALYLSSVFFNWHEAFISEVKIPYNSTLA